MLNHLKAEVVNLLSNSSSKATFLMNGNVHNDSQEIVEAQKWIGMTKTSKPQMSHLVPPTSIVIKRILEEEWYPFMSDWLASWIMTLLKQRSYGAWTRRGEKAMEQAFILKVLNLGEKRVPQQMWCSQENENFLGGWSYITSPKIAYEGMHNWDKGT